MAAPRNGQGRGRPTLRYGMELSEKNREIRPAARSPMISQEKEAQRSSSEEDSRSRQGWWGRQDSNLRSHEAADLQSAPFATRDTPPHRWQLKAGRGNSG
ncbi:hypothetical protein BRADO3008 [Bradyrhizobium sp. ORS 278]|nr:hypothetical protein BRADO3008 [Bradyrhizobium sp. ORS 278]